MSLIPTIQVPLKGIIVSVHCTLGGDQLVFRYPQVFRSKVTEETLNAIFGKKAGTQSAAELKIKDPPTNPSQPPIALSLPEYTPYTMPSVTLCSILSPKLPLCDKLFEIVIDDYRFIGRPTLLPTVAASPSACTPSNPNSGPPSLTSSQSLTPSSSFPPSSSSPSSSLSSSQNSAPHPSPAPNYSNDEDYPSASLPSASHIVSQSGTSQRLDESAGINKPNQPETKARDELTMFNVVLVAEKTLDEKTATMCRRIVTQLAMALKHEQERCQYLHTEVFKVLQLRERWLFRYQKGAGDQKPDHTQLTYELLQASSLATLVKDVFHGLRDSTTAHVRVNNWVSLSLTLSDTEFHPPRPVRPYQTLLIFDPPETMASLPSDASPLLRRLIETAKPTKSFREMQTELGVPLSHLYRMAVHLVYWKKAKIVDTLTKNNVYILNPTPKVEDFYLPFLSQKFETLFPAFRLNDVLQQFSFPKKLGEHVHTLAPNLQRDFVDTVVWLLRQDLLIQIHTYIYLVVPGGGGSFDPNEKSPYPLTPIPLKKYESDYIEQLNNGSKEFALFKRLCPYFRGYHHLTEIAWRENVSKEDLAKVLQSYKSVLVLAQHPEEEGSN